MVKYDRIWELCKETGKKRSYLSKVMGHSERYLLDARKQNTNIKPEELSLLAAELNTTPEYLTGETDDPSTKKDTTVTGDVNTFNNEFYDLLSKLTDAEKSILLAQLRGIVQNR